LDAAGQGIVCVVSLAIVLALADEARGERISSGGCRPRADADGPQLHDQVGARPAGRRQPLSHSFGAFGLNRGERAVLAALS
jgi:hypothetical protein